MARGLSTPSLMHCSDWSTGDWLPSTIGDGPRIGSYGGSGSRGDALDLAADEYVCYVKIRHGDNLEGFEVKTNKRDRG